MKLYKHITTIFLLLISNIAFAQLDDLFWFAMPEVTPRHNNSEPTFLRITSAEDQVYGDHVIVDMPATGLELYNGTIAPGTTYSLNLTDSIQVEYGGTFTDGEGSSNILESGQPGTEGKVENRGIRIRSLGLNALDTQNKITVYCDRNNSNNKDIWALKGRNGFGTKFTVPMQNIWVNRYWNILKPPIALSGVDIVATTNGTTVTVKAKAPFRLAGGANNYYAANTNHTFSLNMGQTFAIVASDTARASHFGGTLITADAPIAVSNRDDSVDPNVTGSHGYDLVGDQLIPDMLGGYEFIVMRGELSSDPNTTKKSREYAFIVAIEDNTKLIDCNANSTYGMFTDLEYASTYPTGTTTTLNAGQVGRILMNARNHNNRVSGTDATKQNFDALYMKFDKPVHVFHVTGFGDEIGGAVVPSIDLCTGSKDVSVVRSSNQNFYINIMTRTAYRDSIDIKINGNWYNNVNEGESFFEPLAGTDWWYLKKPYNRFDQNTNPTGVTVASGVIARIKSPGRFHLSTIEGNTDGCKYGYFSSFAADTGSAVVGSTETINDRYCWGDTIWLKGKGALNYKWWYAGDVTHNHRFLTDSTIAQPIAVIEPNESINELYKVAIVKDCYTSATPYDTLQVQVKVYQKVIAAFDTLPLSPNCCSPVDFKFENIEQGYTTYKWKIPNQTDTINYTGVEYYDTVTFRNTTNAPVYYNVELIANKNYLCYDTIVKPIKINPEIIARMSKGNRSGCQQDIYQEFFVTGSSGPYTDILWDWGDGTGQENYPAADSLNTFPHVFVNLTNFDTTYNVTLVLIDSVNDCRDTAKIETVFVPGVARARYTLSNKKGCSPLAINMQNNTKGIVSYKWWFRTGNNTATTPDATYKFTDTTITFTNNTASPVNYYTYLEITKQNLDGSTCTDTYGPDTITVYPQWTTTITDYGALEGCEPHIVDYNSTVTPAVPNLTYYWNFGNGATSAAANPAATTYSHTSPTDQNYSVSLITTSEYNCKDTATPLNVRVYPFNDARFTVLPDTFSCVTDKPAVFSIQNISISTPDSTTWTDNDTTFAPVTNPFSRTYNNTTGVIQNKTILLTNNNGHDQCNKTYTKTLTVKPQFTPDFTLSSNSICHNGEITFTNNSKFDVVNTPINSPTHTFFWEFGDGTTSSLENPSHKYQNTENNGTTAQTFNVTLTVTTFGCSKSITKTIDVKPEVKAIMSSVSYIVCAPDTIILNNNSFGATGFQWTFTDGTLPSNSSAPSIEYAIDNTNPNNTATYRVKLKAYNGTCADSTYKDFLVYPHVVPVITANQNSGCAPLDINLTNSSTGGNLTYNWQFGDGDQATAGLGTLTHQFQNQTPADTTYTVTLRATNAAGCHNTASVNITAYPQITPDFILNKVSNCSPHPVNFNNTSVNGNQFIWDFGHMHKDTITYNTNQFEYLFENQQPNTPVTYNVKLIVNDTNHPQCKDSVTKKVTIFPQVIAGFGITDGAQGCSPLTTSFNNSSTGYKLKYIWNYNDGNTSNTTDADHSHQFNNLTANDITYKVLLTATDSAGCQHTHTNNVTAYPYINAAFDFSIANLCTPHNVNFKNRSTIGANVFEWDFNTMGDTTTFNTADFVRRFDNTDPDEPVFYPVKLKAYNNLHAECTHSVTKHVRVLPRVISNFSITNSTGCSPLEPAFTNNSSGYLLTYKWEYGDTQISDTSAGTHTHSYNNLDAADKNYTIKLTTTDSAGCSQTTQKTVTAYPLIQAGFSYSTQTKCSPHPVSFTNTTLNGSMFVWDFGMGEATHTTESKISFDHQYRNLKPDSVSISTYNISLLSIDKNHPECRDSITKTIQIMPQVISRFAVTNNNIGCSPLPAGFTNTSKGYKLTYLWDYNDGYYSPTNDITHNHSFDNRTAANKTYNVRLLVTDSVGCIHSSEQQVTAYPRVISGFTFLRTGSNCTPVEYEFKYANLNGNNFKWAMGQNNDSVFQTTPLAHKYSYDNPYKNDMATYNINLKVTDTNTGCTHDTTRVISVFPRIISKFNVDTTQGCNPLTVQFTNNSTGGPALYQWNFDDSGELSNIVSPQKTFEHAVNADKTFKPSLLITQIGNENCTSLSDTSILVYSYVNANFALKKDLSTEGGNNEISSGCTDLKLWVSDLSTTNKTWTWDFGRAQDLVIDNQKPDARQLTYKNTYNTAPLRDSVYNIKLVVENQHGCTDTLVKQLVVFPRSVPNFEVEMNGCHPHTTNFKTNTAVVDADTRYFWKLGDGYEQDEPEFKHVYTNFSYTDNKDYKIWLYTSTSNRCLDSISKTITVFPKPLASIIAASNPGDAGCHPFKPVINNLSQAPAGTFYKWSFGNGNGTESTSDETKYPVYNNQTDNVIEFNINMIATTGNNCKDTAEQKITVYPNVISKFNYFDPADTAGCSPHTVEFRNLSNNPAVSFDWDFGNGVTSKLKNPVYKYINTSSNNQQFIVKLYAQSIYGCDSLITDTIDVYLSPAAEYVVIDRVQQYPDTTITFRNLVNPGPWTYNWSFGDGQTSNSSEPVLQHAYNGWGPKADGFSFTTNLHVYSNYCSDDTTITLIISPPSPVVNIETQGSAGCVPHTVNFESNYQYGYNTSFVWEFGDGQKAYTQNPVHEYTEPGVYVARVTIEGDGGTAQATAIVDVHFLPSPAFKFSPSFVMLPDQPVQFYNTSLNSVSYLWRFGDGITDTIKNPVHQYTYEYLDGHDITLVAISDKGCVDSVTHRNAVIVSGEGFIKFPNAFMPSGLSPLDGSYPSPDTENNVFHPYHSGVKDYELWIFNRWGEQLYYSKDILKGWNGKYGNNGKPLGQDVYFWKTKGTYNNGIPFKLAGDVTLIRR